MTDHPSESPEWKKATGGGEYSGAELAILAELDSIVGDDQTASFDQLRGFVATWNAGAPARYEELKNSPLVQHWRKLDKDRKADGCAVYNADRRLTYMLRVLYEENRIAVRYVTGLSLPAKTARRNQREAERKAKARANMTPEEKAAESAKRAARRAAQKAANATT